MLDLSNAEAIGGDDAGFIVELLSVFLKNIPSHKASLKEHYQSNDMPALGAAVHKLKSATSVLGMKEFGLQLKELEHECLKEKPKDTITPAYNDVLAVLDKEILLVEKELKERKANLD